LNTYGVQLRGFVTCGQSLPTGNEGNGSPCIFDESCASYICRAFPGFPQDICQGCSASEPCTIGECDTTTGQCPPYCNSLLNPCAIPNTCDTTTGQCTNQCFYNAQQNNNVLAVLPQNITPTVDTVIIVQGIRQIELVIKANGELRFVGSVGTDEIELGFTAPLADVWYPLSPSTNFKRECYRVVYNKPGGATTTKVNVTCTTPGNPQAAYIGGDVVISSEGRCANGQPAAIVPSLPIIGGNKNGLTHYPLNTLETFSCGPTSSNPLVYATVTCCPH